MGRHFRASLLILCRYVIVLIIAVFLQQFGLNENRNSFFPPNVSLAFLLPNNFSFQISL